MDRLERVRERGRVEQVRAEPEQADDEGERHRVDRLREEQVSDAFDVADDAAALGDDVRQRRELVVEQDDLGDGACRVAAGAHGDADVRVLEGEDVVDAVTGHRDDVVAAVQRPHHRALAVGLDAAEHDALVERVGEFGCVRGQLACVERLVGLAEAEGFGDGADAARVVAGDDLHLDALVVEVLECLRGVGAHLLREHDEGARRQLAGRAVGVDARLRLGEQQNASAARADLGRALTVGAVGVEQDVGGAHDPVAVPGERDARPLRRGTERRPRLDAPARRIAERVLDGEHRRVRVLVGVREGRECLLRTALVGVTERFDTIECHAGFGEGARLVGADDIDAREALDRWQLVDEALTAPEADDADGERDGRQQHEALGHHRGQCGHHAEDGLLPVVAREQQLVDDRDEAGGDEQVGDDLEDAVDAAAQFGAHEREFAGVGRELGGVRISTDGGGAHQPRARDDEAAGAQFVVAALVDRV